MDQNDIEKIIAERKQLFRELSPERFAYEDDATVSTAITAFSAAAGMMQQVIGQAYAIAIQAGWEEREALTLAIGAVGGAAVAFRLNNEEKLAPELCDEYVDLFARYSGTLAENAKAEAAATTDNIIHGLFGREPGSNNEVH